MGRLVRVRTGGKSWGYNGGEADWRAAVSREMQVDLWYADTATVTTPPNTLHERRNGQRPKVHAAAE